MAELTQKQLKTLKKLMETAETNLAGARELITGLVGDDEVGPPTVTESVTDSVDGKVIEGVFDGQNMQGPGGKLYPVPANYASKSKMVQGDPLKLTIASDGSFIYKQIRPVERRKAIGTLKLADGQYSIEAEGKEYRVLFASISYYHLQPGDQVTIVLPQSGQANWAAIEVPLA